MTSVADLPVESEEIVRKHRRGNRWMHWINFPLLSIMIWSGLRIYSPSLAWHMVCICGVPADGAN